ncbi:hypothetical protein [Arthrobacter psychrolactophilus]
MAAQAPYSQPGLRSVSQLDVLRPQTRIRALEDNHRPHRTWKGFDARKKRAFTAHTAIARELA